MNRRSPVASSGLSRLRLRALALTTTDSGAALLPELRTSVKTIKEEKELVK